jgi:DHA2 family multidrug resistance protein
VRTVDARILVIAGLSLTSASLYMMMGFSPGMDQTPIITSGIVQGLGLGLVFVPLSTLAFSTLDLRYRADATAFFSLVRNIGSSLGISVVSVHLTRNTKINHAEIAGSLTPFNPVLARALPGAVSGDRAALARLDGMVNIQALMVSYVDDFKFIFVITLVAMVLALFLRSPPRGGTAPQAAAMAE